MSAMMIAASEMASGTKQPTGSRTTVVYVCILLALIIWAVFGQTLTHEFIDYDDPAYVTENAVITNGITLHTIAWAFTHVHSGNWHPLTTISHMLDCQLYGLRPGGHHFTNVLLHTVAATLLFLVLRAMTGGPSSPRDESVLSADRTGGLWRSAFVAAIFAVHPLRVESVAWVAERKDVLSGVFFLLTLAAYLRYTRRQSPGNYLLVTLPFVLGLMSKPILVTLPIVLLLIDYWPLGRFTAKTAVGRGGPVASWFGRLPTMWKLVVEKVPLLLLSGASCVVTLLVQRQAMHSGSFVPLWVRGYTAIISCTKYIYQMVWPARLALFYPYPIGALSIWPFALALALLIAITVTAVKRRTRQPYLITGWLWYLVMLMPVIGLVQVGIQARADRYTYLSQIGLYLAVIWGITDFCASWRHSRGILLIGGVVTVAAFSWRAWIQTSYWKNSDSIWAQTVAVTSNNVLAHGNLAFALLKKGRFDDAIPQFEQTLKLPGDLGVKPRDSLVASLHYGLANALLHNSVWDKAIFHYSKVREWDPGYQHVELNLGTALLRAGRTNEAIAVWQNALAAHRDEVEVHAYLGYALLVKGLPGEAIVEYEKALQIAPESAGSLNDLAWVLATCSDSRLRDGSRAVHLAQRANQLSGGKNPVFIRTLAAAYAEAGRFEDATEAAQRALKLATAQHDLALTNQLQADTKLYRMNQKRVDKVTAESARH